jgi:hypothetical protein
MTEHPQLKNLYETVIASKYGWERWGLLSALSDCVVNHVKGDILEIGCGESSVYLSKIAEKYHRSCYHVEYSKSGVVNMKATKGYFGENSFVYNGKSDDFFAGTHELEKPFSVFALAFIDGDHQYDYVARDFYHTVQFLAPGGFIFLHDTYPPDITWTSDNKCGTVFELRIEIEEDPLYEVFTFPFTAFNVGLSMIRIKDDREWEADIGTSIK